MHQAKHRPRHDASGHHTARRGGRPTHDEGGRQSVPGGGRVSLHHSLRRPGAIRVSSTDGGGGGGGGGEFGPR